MTVATAAPQNQNEDSLKKTTPMTNLNHNNNNNEKLDAEVPHESIPLDSNGQLEANDASSGTSISNLSSLSNKSNVKCSAIHTLERDMPTFDYSDMIEKLRERIIEKYEQNPGIYSKKDIDKCREDDWHLSRFLLRQKMDIDAAFEMITKAMRFKHESLNNSIRPEDFPAEFYKIGGLFGYNQDRKGNKMLFMRIKVHRKMPELQSILEAFVFHNIERIDQEAKGRGISICLDCTGSGVNNVDMDTLMFLISSLTNYFPKGLSYLLVHNLPWILKPIWHIAKLCIPEEYRQLVKFSDSKTIFEYIDKDQLPKYMGGTCSKDHCQVPENCTNLFEACKLWGIERDVARLVLSRFEAHLPPESLSDFDKLCEQYSAKQMETEGNSDTNAVTSNIPELCQA